ncbi:hypothetical protein ACFWDI_37185 [Streptomyces sp. NPDC060064]|uniref:hypothetical protein n=1 Tax=Streptomyces sp. NPDC060064 TaxID=3347049 RepID=UPI003679215C
MAACTGMAKALERVDEIASLGLGRVRIDKVPPNRLATLARTGSWQPAAAVGLIA